ncbi:MAG: alpha/beta fold hydrolase [Boseongicola sp.]|nr:MAG: alpha/beta fold hydrolase [Boseongicola sp.]QMU59105.1 MAG: alpha/beta fold hydrolase [Boseongicola sp.]
MTPLVLVHGFMGGSDQWGPQKNLAADLKLIRLDLPGYGRAADQNAIASIDGMARWALDHLADMGIRTFDLLGHSMGGMVVQEMVRQEPERIRKLILYATGPTGVLPDRFEPIETSIARATADGAETTARRIAATWFLDEQSVDDNAGCLDLAARSGLPAILAGLEAMRGWSGEDYLSEIAADTLVIWGDQDRTYGWPQVEQLWMTIPNSHLAVLPLCAHAIHLEKPKFFNAILMDFLSK